jgi:hypothetical protein
MPLPPIFNVPGVQSDRTATQRRVMKQSTYEMIAGGGVINGATARDPGNTSDVDKLRAGMLMGLITATDQWSPSLFGVTTNAEAVGATTIEAAAGVITELVRRVGASGTFLMVGPPTANGVVDSETVTYSAASGTAITATALTKAFVAGSFIMPNDGSQNMISLIPDGYPVKVTDGDAASIDVEWPCIPIGGVLDSSQIVNWPSDTSLQAYIMARLNGGGGSRFVFDHVFMGE